MNLLGTWQPNSKNPYERLKANDGMYRTEHRGFCELALRDLLLFLRVVKTDICFLIKLVAHLQSKKLQ